MLRTIGIFGKSVSVSEEVNLRQLSTRNYQNRTVGIFQQSGRCDRQFSQ